MPSNDGELGSLLKAFYRSELGSLQNAAGIVIRSVADTTVEKVKADLATNLKNHGTPQSGAFFRAVKAYHLRPRGTLGHASYVRVGPRFASIFQEGGTIQARKTLLVIRLPGAEKLGLPRVGKKGSFRAILSKLGNRVFKRPGKGGYVFFYRVSDTQIVPIYKLQPAVQMPKKLHFFEIAEEEARKIPNLISRITEK